MNKIKLTPQTFTFGIYSISSFICAIFASWTILASVDFAYPFLHDSLNIDQHTAKYGPQNRYRDHFENTDRSERIRLFSAINHSIHNHGVGLEQINYHDKNSNIKIDSLLHTSEILHLKDVAKLIDVFKYTAIAAFMLWIALILYFYRRQLPPPNIKQQSFSTLAVLSIATVAVLLIGPINVFYAFHEWLFPANHKWFFYYQESLMTILMKAPFLFGYIAILILALCIPIFIVFNIISSKILKSININFRK